MIRVSSGSSLTTTRPAGEVRARLNDRPARVEDLDELFVPLRVSERREVRRRTRPELPCERSGPDVGVGLHLLPQ